MQATLSTVTMLRSKPPVRSRKGEVQRNPPACPEGFSPAVEPVVFVNVSAAAVSPTSTSRRLSKGAVAAPALCLEQKRGPRLHLAKRHHS
eukprot:5434387-Amphidinium_carterae.1